MGTITAQSIIDRAAIVLNDVAGVRWDVPECLKWISDGQREAASVRPSSCNKVSVVKLAAGTRQALPSDGHVLMSVIRNMGINGSTPGRAIRIVRQEVIDNLNPDWHSDTKTSAVENYVYDLQDQTSFFVYPPNDGTGYVEINYGKVPGELTNANQAIELLDVLSPALVSYLLSRAYTKEGETFSQTAVAYYQQFMNQLGVKDTGDTTASANMQLLPSNPTVEGSNK